MSMGMKVLDASANVLLDTSTVTVRILDYVDVGAGSSGSTSDAKYSGARVIAVAMSSSPSNVTLPHVASISGTTLTYTAKGSVTPSRLIVYKES